MLPLSFLISNLNLAMPPLVLGPGMAEMEWILSVLRLEMLDFGQAFSWPLKPFSLVLQELRMMMNSL